VRLGLLLKFTSNQLTLFQFINISGQKPVRIAVKEVALGDGVNHQMCSSTYNQGPLKEIC
jgi:hypothetical protein